MIRKLKRAFLLLAALFAGGAALAMTGSPRTITTNVYDVTSVPKIVAIHEDDFRNWLNHSYSTWHDYGGSSEMHYPPKDSAIVIKITDGTNSQIFDNLYPGRSYPWTVGDKSGTFTVESQAPRTLNTVDLVANDDIRNCGRNVRDLGGWKLINGDGRRTNFDVFFRTANWDAWINYTGDLVCPLHTFAKTEIDLRGNNIPHSGSTSPSDGSVNFYSYSVNYTYGKDVGKLANVFHVLGNAANHPVAFHCTAGKDRTGMVAYYIEALCGMYEDDIYRDFFATTFSGWGSPEIAVKWVATYGGIDYYSRQLRAMVYKPYGESLAGLSRAYLEGIGVTESELETITLALTGETLDEVLDRVNAVPLSAQVSPPDDEDPTGDDDDPTGGDEDPTGGDGELDPSTQKATGGDNIHAINVDGTYYWVHEFRNTAAAASFVNTSGADLPVEYLVVGGGGAGGDGYASTIAGGGGGGGGVIYKEDGLLPAGDSWSIYVGKGGSVIGSNNNRIKIGDARIPAGASAISNSTATAVVAYAPGGGAGSSGNSASRATSGASGGGAARTITSQPGSGEDGLGHAGGSVTVNSKGAGGGGGAGSLGANGEAGKSGKGGAGICNDITGSDVFYGCGGGGSASFENKSPFAKVVVEGEGGSDGVSGGNGGNSTDSPAQNGLNGTGCGGGGGITKNENESTKTGNAANGGDGIVVIRYAVSATPTPPTPSTYTVTFYTNNNQVVKTLANKSSGYTIRNSDLPSVSGGEWDVNPVGAVVSSNTNFTYTILKYWTVTFTRDETNTLDTIQVADRRMIPASSIPTIMGSGSWDPDPSTAVITDDTTFNYTTATTPVDPDEPVIPTGGPLAEGGTVTQIEQNGKHYYVHTFTDTTAAQTFVNTSGADLEVEYLVVGGGGAGGDGHVYSDGFGGGGGGGGGQVIEMSGTLAVGDSWNVYVGAGGSVMDGDKHITVRSARFPAQASAISNGTDQVTLALGGGSGASTTGVVATPTNGEDYYTGGGGSARGTSSSGAYPVGGIGVMYSGGKGYWNKKGDGDQAGGGGGAGAGGNGEDGSDSKGGDGGAGVSSSITGSLVFYGGGGGGGAGMNAVAGSGVNGGNGGERPKEGNVKAAEDGTPNTGNGGGGGAINGSSADYEGNAGNGGSGVVIIRYEAGVGPAPAPEFDVTFSSNNVPVEAYNTTVVSNGHLTVDAIPAWAGGTWDVSPFGATIICATNFNCVVKEIEIVTMPFPVIGAESGSVISFTGSYTAGSGSAYVQGGTTATLGAKDVTGKTYCGCWRDDSTGELFWGETVTVSPAKDTKYTACFGPMWQLYKDPLYGKVAANNYYHLDNGIWDFKADLNPATGKITVRKLLSHASSDTDRIVNFTTPVMDDMGVTNGYAIAYFANWDDANNGWAEVFEKSNDTKRDSWNHYKLPKLLLLPVTTEEVYVMALRNLENLQGVLCIPENAKLYKQAFAYNKNLEGLIFKGGVEGGQTFPIAHYWDHSGEKWDEGNQFENCTKLAGSVVLPKSITYIPPNCFHTDKSLQEIDLTYVTNVSNRGLYDCHSLTNAIGLEALKSVTFMGCCGCWNLKGDVTFTNLESGCFCAFANCGFTSVKLPKANEFHYGVFANNPGLTNIVFSTRRVTFAYEPSDDHPGWSYKDVSGAYCTNNSPCWLEFPGMAPIFTNIANRATCSIIFGEQDVEHPLSAPKELCLQGDWDYDPEDWQKIYDEIGDPMPYNSARPIQNVPADLDVRGTINWMDKFDYKGFSWSTIKYKKDDATGKDVEDDDGNKIILNPDCDQATYGCGENDPLAVEIRSERGYYNVNTNPPAAKAFLISRPKGLYFFVK